MSESTFNMFDWSVKINAQECAVASKNARTKKSMTYYDNFFIKTWSSQKNADKKSLARYR